MTKNDVISEKLDFCFLDLFICFIDYEKAFDRAEWRKMMWMLKDIEWTGGIEI